MTAGLDRFLRRKTEEKVFPEDSTVPKDDEQLQSMMGIEGFCRRDFSVSVGCQQLSPLDGPPAQS